MVFILGAAGFIVVSLFFGIFKPRKAMPSDPVQAIEFGQSKGLARKEGKTSIKFDDVGGLGREVEEFQEVVEFLKDPIRFTTLGAKPPKGLLLEGGPGTGKTLVAKAIAGEAGVPFYEMSGSEFVEIIVGVGAARVRDLFKRARINAPCIIFIDEIDALGFARADSQTQTNEEREQTLNQLLTEMDGFTPDTGVVLVAATNRADLLDPALMRAGRFDRKIKIQLPTEEGRFEILKVHARKHRVAPGLDLRQLARDLPGLSGAELANLMNEAALTAVRRDAGEIHDVDVYAAMDRILEGAKRPGLSRKLGVVYGLAVHEAGVAIAASILRMRKDCVEEIRRVSMVPRGKDWTRTVFVYSSDDAYTPITRIASSATSSHTEVLEGITLPTEFSKEMVGFEVHEILKVCYAEVCGILSEHRGALLAVADRLLDSEQIFGEELVRILEAGGSNKSTQLGPGYDSEHHLAVIWNRTIRSTADPFLSRSAEVRSHAFLSSDFRCVRSFFYLLREHELEGVGVGIPREDGRSSGLAGGVRPSSFVEHLLDPLELGHRDADVSISSTVFGSAFQRRWVRIGQFHEVHLLSWTDA
eukprot:jgi/Pico_ML_1/50571/g1757.t2